MQRKCLLATAVGALLLALCPLQAQADRLFAVTGAGHSESILYELDPTTGAVVEVIGSCGLTAGHLSSLAIHPTTGVFYAYVNEYVEYNVGALATLDMDTGLATVVGVSTPTHVPDMTFDASGTLYGWSEGGFTGDDLITFDLVTGEVFLVGESGIGTASTGLGCDSADNMYVKPAMDLYSVDHITGGANYLLSLTADAKNSLAFDGDDNCHSIYREGSTTTYYLGIDISTGAVTTIGDIGVANISAIEFSTGTTPTEHGTWGGIKSLFR